MTHQELRKRRDDTPGATEKTQYESARNAQEITGNSVGVSGKTGQIDIMLTRRPADF